MFCTSLRRRSSFLPVIPALTLSSSLGLVERHIGTHDVALPLAASIDPRTRSSTGSTEQLRVLLLSLSRVTDTHLQATVDRIRHLTAITSGRHVAVVFLLDPPRDTGFRSAKQMLAEADDTNDYADSSHSVLAYCRLQAALADRHDIPNISVLPLSRLHGLPELLRKHAAALATRYTQVLVVPPPLPTPFDLLRQCIAGSPMSEETALYLSDLFPNFRELAAACCTAGPAPSSSSPSLSAFASDSIMPQTNHETFSDSHGPLPSGSATHRALTQLRDIVGGTTCQRVVDFWKDERIVE